MRVKVSLPDGRSCTGSIRNPGLTTIGGLARQAAKRFGIDSPCGLFSPVRGEVLRPDMPSSVLMPDQDFSLGLVLSLTPSRN